MKVTGVMDEENKRTVAGRYSSVMRSCKKLSGASGNEAPTIVIETATDKCIAVREYDTNCIVVLKANTTST